MTTNDRKRESEAALTAVMVRSPYEMANVSDRLNTAMFDASNRVALACMELHAEQYTYTALEVSVRSGVRFDDVVQKSMLHGDLELETAVDMFLLAYEATVEELIGQSVPYWTSKGMGTDDVRNEAEKVRKEKHIGAFMKMDTGRADFEKSLITALDGVEVTHPIQPFLSSLQKSVGYWKPGDYIISAGRTGMGKSYFGLNQIFHSAKAGNHCHYINLENAPIDVQTRLWQYETKTYFQNPFRGITDQKRNEYMEAWEAVKKLPVHAHNPGRSLSNIVTAIRREYYERGTALVVLDYIQLVKAGIKGNPLADHAEVSATIRQLALELKIPIIALAQIGRGVESSATKRPSISDLRGAGDFENDATTVLLLYRPEYYHIENDEKGDPYPPNFADVTIGKGRNTGSAICECRFDHVRGFYSENTYLETANSQFPTNVFNRSEDIHGAGGIRKVGRPVR